jgi:hypothetical protein
MDTGRKGVAVERHALMRRGLKVTEKVIEALDEESRKTCPDEKGIERR